MKNHWNARMTLRCFLAITTAQLLFPQVVRTQTSTPTFTTIYTFLPQPDGCLPIGSLTPAPDGSLFGVTQEGGLDGVGAVYQLVPVSSGWNEQILYSYFGSLMGPGDTGELPSGGVVIGTDGSLSGPTRFTFFAPSLGMDYQLTPPIAGGGFWTSTLLHAFGNGEDGAGPTNSLVSDGNGIFYGTTLKGGALNYGTIYQLVPPSTLGDPWTETVLYNFTGSRDGGGPNQIVRNSNGVLFGTTQYGGGTGAKGVAYRLVPPREPGGLWTQYVLHAFVGGSDGINPTAGLVFDALGSAYGTTYMGGSANAGVIFKLTPPPPGVGAWEETILHTFTNVPDGAFPSARVVQGASGTLFGTTSSGGQFNFGTVFSLVPPATPSAPWSENVLYHFTGGSDGHTPGYGVVFGLGGALYGNTRGGSREYDCGTVFMLH